MTPAKLIAGLPLEEVEPAAVDWSTRLDLLVTKEMEGGYEIARNKKK